MLLVLTLFAAVVDGVIVVNVAAVAVAAVVVFVAAVCVCRCCCTVRPPIGNSYWE